MDSLKCTENESFLKGQLANIIVKVLLQQNHANNFFLVSFLLIVLLQLSQLFTHCSPQHCPLPHSHSKSPPSCPGPGDLDTCSLMLIIFNILEFYRNYMHSLFELWCLSLSFSCSHSFLCCFMPSFPFCQCQGHFKEQGPIFILKTLLQLIFTAKPIGTHFNS